MGNAVQELYGDFWGKARPGFDERISQSLNPRDPDMLDELFAELGISEEDTILDIGCRDALNAVEFVQRFHCRAIALDPVPLHMDWARQRVAEAGLEERVMLMLTGIEELPLDDESVDHIWCRDVLPLVDLSRGLSECFRVLKPGGTMLTFQTLATELLEPREAERLFQASAKDHPENMSCEYFESTARNAGFAIIHREEIGSEWRENALENGWGLMNEDLLQLSRMRRLEEELVRDYGRRFYEAAYVARLWNLYQVLGKLSSWVHTLQKPSS